LDDLRRIEVDHGHDTPGVIPDQQLHGTARLSESRGDLPHFDRPAIGELPGELVLEDWLSKRRREKAAVRIWRSWRETEIGAGRVPNPVETAPVSRPEVVGRGEPVPRARQRRRWVAN